MHQVIAVVAVKSCYFGEILLQLYRPIRSSYLNMGKLGQFVDGVQGAPCRDKLSC